MIWPFRRKKSNPIEQATDGTLRLTVILWRLSVIRSMQKCTGSNGNSTQCPVLIYLQIYGTVRWTLGGRFVTSKQTKETAVRFLLGRVQSCLTDGFCSVVLSRDATTASAEQATNHGMHESRRTRPMAMKIKPATS